ncbi:MAG: hypothetical protein FJ123_12665 [Deltaproteobacteria bacterium]|nr:hypothetical protein [Deltaproteobacteria bacterium]
MKTPSFKKVSTGEIQGWLREDILPFLPFSFFEDPIRFIADVGGRVIGESKWRKSALFSLPNGKHLFFKMDSTKGRTESLKYLLFPSKGRKEWFISYQMKKKNLPIPDPLGWLERVHRGLVMESYYLSEAVESGVPLAEEPDLLRDEKVFSGLVKTVIRIHQSGLDHKDFHAGNFLWDGESFFLTDLHRARITNSLSLKQRLWSLAYLFHSLRSIWGKGDRVEFLKAYLDGSSTHIGKPAECLKRIDSWMDRLQRRQWTSRTRRCLKDSTEFVIRREKGRVAYHRKDFPFDRLERVIGRHLDLLKENPSGLLKQSPEIIVSLIEDGGDRICVKQFCYPKLIDRLKEAFRLSKGLKAWIGGNGLRARGISTVQPLGFIEKNDLFGPAESFFVMEAPQGSQELDRYLFKGIDTFEEKRRFIKACANWLFHLHEKNLYHQDMKACNILVLREGQMWDFSLLDLEDLQLNSKVDEKRLFKNLLQLNTSIPSLVTRADRLRFFRAYVVQHPTVRNERAFLYRLIQKSKERGVVYVSPYGVIKENL